MKDAQANLNANADEWALHMFLPSSDQSLVTIVMVSARVLRQQQIAGAR